MKPTTISALGLLLLSPTAVAQSGTSTIETVSYSTDSYGNVYTSTIYASSTITSQAASAASGGGSGVNSSSLSYGSSTAGSGYDTATTTLATRSTRGLPAIQTQAYTGQALLVGT